MKKEIDHLLQPRYKVIADYPDAIKIVGEIFNTYENGVAYVTEILKCDVGEFPHLFRKLKWHKDIKEKDLPMFVKYNSGTKMEFILKVENYLYHLNLNDIWAFDYFWDNEPDLKRASIIGWEPATEEEYLLSIKK